MLHLPLNLTPSLSCFGECAMSNEANARIIIDRLLREADWDIVNTVQVSAKEAVAGYVLNDSRSRLLAFIEAKRISIDRVGPKHEPLVVIEVVAVNNAQVYSPRFSPRFDGYVSFAVLD